MTGEVEIGTGEGAQIIGVQVQIGLSLDVAQVGPIFPSIRKDGKREILEKFEGGYLLTTKGSGDQRRYR